MTIFSLIANVFTNLRLIVLSEANIMLNPNHKKALPEKFRQGQKHK